MAIDNIPLAVLAGTVSTYWFVVGVMVVRIRRKTHQDVGVVPEQRLERWLCLIWVPLVAGWIAVPWATLNHSAAVPALPDFAVHELAYVALRWFAAILAVISLAATIKCWVRMGNDWRMDIDLNRKTELIVDGLFARVRHPIYAFSILLMLCSAAIVPTTPMLVIAAAHIMLMNIKARNEERHLASVHGDTYATYLTRTGRFLPRWSRR